jgi:hypothetical protein
MGVPVTGYLHINDEGLQSVLNGLASKISSGSLDVSFTATLLE